MINLVVEKAARWDYIFLQQSKNKRKFISGFTERDKSLNRRFQRSFRRSNLEWNKILLNAVIF